MKRICLFFIMIAAISFLQAGEKNPLKVFISVDMEGIWGVVHSEQTRPGSRDYDLARKWMVQDVNAVIEGLLEAGAEEIVVNDSHGGMRNIIADELHPKASLISGIVTAAVKQGVGRFAARLLPAEEARKRLKEGAREALLKKDKISIFKPDPPFHFELEFLNSSQADVGKGTDKK